MAALTRRQFVTGAAGGVAALVLITLPAAAPADEPLITAGRLAALGAVLVALGEGPAAGRRPEDVACYVSSFDAHYAASSPAFQRFAGEALDRVDATGLTALAPADALARLRAWAVGEDPVLAATALQLASLTFGEDTRQPGYALS